MKRNLFSVFTGIACMTVSSFAGSIPFSFMIQGQLRRVSPGNDATVTISAVSNATASLQVRLYPSATAVTPVWGRSLRDVPLTGGAFSVELADTCGVSLPACEFETLEEVFEKLPLDAALWSGVTAKGIDGCTTECKRERLPFVPFALETEKASCARGKFQVLRGTASLKTLSVKDSLRCGGTAEFKNDVVFEKLTAFQNGLVVDGCLSRPSVTNLGTLVGLARVSVRDLTAANVTGTATDGGLAFAPRTGTVIPKVTVTGTYGNKEGNPVLSATNAVTTNWKHAGTFNVTDALTWTAGGALSLTNGFTQDAGAIQSDCAVRDFRYYAEKDSFVFLTGWCRDGGRGCSFEFTLNDVEWSRYRTLAHDASFFLELQTTVMFPVRKGEWIRGQNASDRSDSRLSVVTVVPERSVAN